MNPDLAWHAALAASMSVYFGYRIGQVISNALTLIVFNTFRALRKRIFEATYELVWESYDMMQKIFGINLSRAEYDVLMQTFEKDARHVMLTERNILLFHVILSRLWKNVIILLVPLVFFWLSWQYYLFGFCVGLIFSCVLYYLRKGKISMFLFGAMDLVTAAYAHQNQGKALPVIKNS